jgi:arylsulfatase A-like enzyme
VIDAVPRNVVVVLLDSLNRHLLGCYGGTEFDTPTIDRLAARGLRFTNHVAGSLPCMPARHDILVGALDFLWRPWGSIEVWEDAVTYPMRSAGISTMLVSDHPHLFESGGENYHCDFTAWDYVRGHEDDPWRTRPDPSWIGAPALNARSAPWHRGYDVARTHFKDESDFPGPRTMRAAVDWLEREVAGRDADEDRFFLLVDEFDPHEPFDTPAPWVNRYGDPSDPWTDPLLIWPPYARTQEESGLSDREARHVRANYGSKLSMIDAWLGRLIDAVDAHGLWDDTAVIVCTDHGHYLGERGIWGKPAVPQYGPMMHLPLIVWWPGLPAERRGTTIDALTATVDIHATIADVFGVGDELEHRTHGRSLVPLISGEQARVREWALAGVWGREVQVIGDGGATRYSRAPAGDNAPLAMWSNRWSTMPVHVFPQLRLPRPDKRAALDTMPGSDVPVIRQPFDESDQLPFWATRKFTGNHLFDVHADPLEVRNLAGTPRERRAVDLLVAALDDVEAPLEQRLRLGLS